MLLNTGERSKEPSPNQPRKKKFTQYNFSTSKILNRNVGFAFSSTILCEANTQGLSGLGKYQDYRSTLQTSNKHVPILCTRMAVTIYWNSLQSGLGPGFSHSLKIGILCTLSFYSDCSSSLEAKARLSGSRAPCRLLSVVSVHLKYESL